MSVLSPVIVVVCLTLTLNTPQVGAAEPFLESAPTTSPAFGEAFTEAQRALNDKRWSDVIDRAKEVLATDNRRPDDTYAAYYFILEANKGLKDRAGMRDAIHGMLDSGFPISPHTRAVFDRVLESEILATPQN